MAQFFVTYSLQDAYQRRSRKRIELDVLDHTAALARALSFADDLASITGAEILKYDVSQEVAYTDAATGGSNLDAGATLSFLIDTQGKKAAFKVPAVEASVVNADGTIDLTDANILAFEAEMVSTEIKISDGEVPLDLVSGKLDR